MALSKIVSGQEAVQAVANDPFFVMLYGPPGVEKTTDACILAAELAKKGVRSLYVKCEPNSLQSVLARDIPVPPHYPEVIESYEDLGAAVVSAKTEGCGLIIIDTVSTLMNGWARELQPKAATKGVNGWQWAMTIRDRLHELREALKHFGMHALLLAHERPAHVDDKGNKWLTMPQFEPKSAEAIYRPVISTIFRVDYLDIRGKRERVYYTGGPHWPADIIPPKGAYDLIAKNREGIGWSVVPAGLLDILKQRQPPYRGL